MLDQAIPSIASACCNGRDFSVVPAGAAMRRRNP
jgi:hypothetical protein